MLRLAPLAVALASLLLAGCSLKQSNTDSGGTPQAAPPSGAKSTDNNATSQLGFPISATRNTTRVSGGDPVADAAGVANALFPAADATNRPKAVALVDKGDWQGIVAAGVLAGPPVSAPILLTDGDTLPPVTQQTLSNLQPSGSTATGGVQAILVGNKPGAPDKLKSGVIRGGADAYAEAASIDRFSAVARGKPSGDVLIASGEQPAYAMPAAPWAAKSGDSVLFVKKDSIPPPTRAALVEHQRPNIWVLGPPEAIGPKVMSDLGKLGTVKRIAGTGPVGTATAFARYKSGAFGWDANLAGQNLTIANLGRPGDAAAAAGLGANGIFAPLLLTDRADFLPRELEGFLLDLQPGFQGAGPSRSQGVWDHVWILGAEDALSKQAQARIDSAVALVPVDKTPR